MEYVDNNPDEPLGLYELAWTYHISLQIPDNYKIALDLYERSLKNNPGPEMQSITMRKIQDIYTVYTP